MEWYDSNPHFCLITLRLSPIFPNVAIHTLQVDPSYQWFESKATADSGRPVVFRSFRRFSTSSLAVTMAGYDRVVLWGFSICVRWFSSKEVVFHVGVHLVRFLVVSLPLCVSEGDTRGSLGDCVMAPCSVVHRNRRVSGKKIPDRNNVGNMLVRYWILYDNILYDDIF